MGLDQMLDSIKQDTESSYSKKISDARAESERILSQGRARAQEIIEKSKQESDREVQEERTRLIASEKLEGKRRLLEVKEEILKQCEMEAQAQIADFASSSGYKDFLLQKVKQGAEEIGSGAVVHVNSRDKSLLKGLKNLGFDLSPDSLDAAGGALIISKDGKRRVNNTIESILNDRKDVLRLRISKKIFGEKS